MTVLFMDNWNWIANGTNSASSPTLTTLFEEDNYIHPNSNVTDADSEILNTPGPGHTFRLGNTGGQVMRYELVGTTAEIYISVRLKLFEGDSSAPFLSVWGNNGGLRQAGISMGTSWGSFHALGTGNDGTFYVPDFTPGDEITWELYVNSVSGAGNGTITIRANGTQVYHNAAATTFSFGPIDQVRIRNTASGTNEFMEVRDFIVCDTGGTIANTWIGQDKHVYGLLPNADGNYSQWTRSTGTTDYTLVDEVSRSSSDYIEEGTTSTNKTSVGLEATGSETDILAVQVHSNAFLSAAGSEQFREIMRHSTSDGNGTTHTVDSTTEEAFRSIFELNPSTSAQWTAAALDAAEIGVEYI